MVNQNFTLINTFVPTVNKYFNTLGYKNEQRLVEDLTIESIRINGIPIYYVPRILVAADPIFGEDPLSKFISYFEIEAYFNTPDGLGGSPQITKLGFEMPRTTEFLISRRRFNQCVRYDNYTAMPNQQLTAVEVRPLDGDLIYTPLSKELFQISYADHEINYYTLGYRYLWRLEVQKYNYSAETIQTGMADIDRVQLLFDNVNSVANDPLAENTVINTLSSAIEDNTEMNIFGDPI